MKNNCRCFETKHPRIYRWVREGGLFIIVSNMITVLKYLLLQFLPKFLGWLPMIDFGWPGKEVTFLGESFKWNVLGYDVNHGGHKTGTYLRGRLKVSKTVHKTVLCHSALQIKGYSHE